MNEPNIFIIKNMLNIGVLRLRILATGTVFNCIDWSILSVYSLYILNYIFNFHINNDNICVHT